MKAKMWENLEGARCLYVEFTRHDYLHVRLDRIDRAQLAEPIKSVADLLLDAELIARRLEELPR